jgi:membrane-bound metal-dependent hydrolase YbcI (DUF457 family)
VILAAAVAPDLDLLLRFVDGRNHHQAASHSLGAALIVGVLVCLAAVGRGWRTASSLGLGAALGWTTHVALDYLGRDTNPPIGVMALWPLSPAYLKFPWPVFLDVGRTLTWVTVGHNAVAVAWEVTLLAPLAFVAWRWRRPSLPRAD